MSVGNSAGSGYSSPVISFGSFDRDEEHALSDSCCSDPQLVPPPLPDSQEAVRRTRRRSYQPLEYWRHEQRPEAPLPEHGRDAVLTIVRARNASSALNALSALDLSPISPRSNTWSPTSTSPRIDSASPPAESRGAPLEFVTIGSLVPDKLLFASAPRKPRLKLAEAAGRLTLPARDSALPLVEQEEGHREESQQNKENAKQNLLNQQSKPLVPRAKKRSSAGAGLHSRRSQPLASRFSSRPPMCTGTPLAPRGEDEERDCQQFVNAAVNRAF